MFNYKKGFKLIRLSKGKYESAFCDGLETEYKIGEWRKRDNFRGPFAVFNTMKNLKAFYKDYGVSGKHVVFTCKYKKSKVKRLFYINSYNEEFKFKLILPKGTKFADKVKILKLIWDGV